MESAPSEDAVKTVNILTTKDLKYYIKLENCFPGNSKTLTTGSSQNIQY